MRAAHSETGQRSHLAGVPAQPGQDPGEHAVALPGRRAGRTEEAERRRDMREAVGHGLRTPLTVILGFADLLLDGAGGTLTASQHEAVTAIREAALKELEVVEEVEALLRSGQVSPRLGAAPSPRRTARSPAG
jgi:signal transduction histidine kinase